MTGLPAVLIVVLFGCVYTMREIVLFAVLEVSMLTEHA
jgi:hypothetical protein